MRTILLFTTCLLLAYLLPADFSVQEGEQPQAQTSPATHEPHGTDLPAPTKVTFNKITSSAHPDHIISPATMGHIAQSMGTRHYSARIQQRTAAQQLLVKQLLRELSHYLTTLIHQISATYNTQKIPNWQRAADAYVFAFRHIII